jgi:hypothetical protein
MLDGHDHEINGFGTATATIFIYIEKCGNGPKGSQIRYARPGCVMLNDVRCRVCIVVAEYSTGLAILLSKVENGSADEQICHSLAQTTMVCEPMK